MTGYMRTTVLRRALCLIVFPMGSPFTGGEVVRPVPPDQSMEGAIMYSRREFGKIALVGLPPASALAKINSKVGGVQLAVQTYSFRDQDGGVDAIIKFMTDIGIGEC